MCIMDGITKAASQEVSGTVEIKIEPVESDLGSDVRLKEKSSALQDRKPVFRSYASNAKHLTELSSKTYSTDAEDTKPSIAELDRVHQMRTAANDSLLTVKTEHQTATVKTEQNVDENNDVGKNPINRCKAEVHPVGLFFNAYSPQYLQAQGTLTSTTSSVSKSSLQCSQCFRFFRNEHDFERHAKTHTVKAEGTWSEIPLKDKPYVCTVCSAAFLNLYLLQRHAQTHAESARLHGYKCGKCGSTFQEKSVLEKHACKKVRPVKCDKCSAAFAKQSMLREHMKLHLANQPYRCAKCPAAFVRMCDLKDHLKGHTRENPFKCLECPSSFTRLSDLKEHAATHTVNNEHRCSECSATFNSAVDLKVHSQIHAEEENMNGSKLSCEKCHVFMSTAQDLINHMRENHPIDKPFVCECCLAGFSSLQELESHTNTCVHRAENLYKCTHCSKPFQSEGKLKLHAALEHKVGSKFQCEQCQVEFDQKSGILGHFYTHHYKEIKTYKCMHCTASFEQFESLETHVVTHTGERHFKCQHCPASFTTQPKLNAHRQDHWLVNLYRCPLCSMAFKRKVDFASHKHSHHMKGGKIFQCPKCPTSYTRMTTLKAHIFTHSKDNPYKCPQCLLTFSSLRTLKNHRWTHVDGSFKCQLCPAVFSTFSGRGAHYRLIHKVRMIISRPGGKKIYRCQDCPHLQFPSRYLRNKHRLAHPRQQRHPCPICPAKFYNNNTLKIHMRRNHSGRDNCIHGAQDHSVS